MERDRFVEKCIGCLLGTLVGDALGAPVEGLSARTIEAYFAPSAEVPPGDPRPPLARLLVETIPPARARLGPGSYTDDTEMTAATAESLVACRGFDPEDMARRFLARCDPRRGYGPGTLAVLEAIAQGSPIEDAARAAFPEGSFGDGAAMRIAPIGLLYHRDKGSLVEIAERAAAITHAHPLGRMGAAVQALAVACALEADPAEALEPERFVEALLPHLPRNEAGEAFRDAIRRSLQLAIRCAAPREASRELGCDARAIAAVPCALYAFLRARGDFEKAVLGAVATGGDTDTIAAMAGALAGAYTGRQAIPETWLQSLEEGGCGVRRLEELARELAGLALSGASAGS